MVSENFNSAMNELSFSIDIANGLFFYDVRKTIIKTEKRDGTTIYENAYSIDRKIGNVVLVALDLVHCVGGLVAVRLPSN